MATAAEIELEQAYFDRALAERERQLAEIERSPENAAGSKPATDLRRLAKRLREAATDDSPIAFGRFDTDDGEVFYLGNNHVTTPDFDMLVINWRSAAAEPYYRASVEDRCGVRRRRTFDAPRSRIVTIDDVILAELQESVEGLDTRREPTLDDALLRDLERQRTGEMQDIVQTITAAQHDLIRLPLDRLLIIQGGPGTGKTAIALHRVSWLLFNFSDELAPDRVLVVGPSLTFSRYIRALLPSLGDGDVVQTNLQRLGPVQSDQRLEPADVAALKGDGRMAGMLQRAVSNRVRVPAGSADYEVSTRSGPVRIPMEDLRQTIETARQAPTYSAGRAQVRNWITSQAELSRTSTVSASASEIDQAVERVWPSMTPASFMRELLGSRDRLFEAAGSAFSAEEAGRLYRQSAERISEETWSDADVALLDEAEALIQGGTGQFDHIVVDEAQDLTAMQLRSLRRRSASGSMTLVGDLAQSTGPGARGSWDDVLEALGDRAPTDLRPLKYGYRVPRQVMDIAGPLLPMIAPDVEPPIVVRSAPEDPLMLEVDDDQHPDEAVRVARDWAGRGHSVGIVVPSPWRDGIVAELERQGVKWIDSSTGNLGQGINLVSPVEAKGLEFDAVVVVSPREIARESEFGLRLLYIALTRTTRFLAVIHDGAILPGLQSPVEEGLHDVPSVTEEDATSNGSRTKRDGANAVATRTVQPEGGGIDIASAVVGSTARAVADQLRANVPPHMWSRILDHIRGELGLDED